MKPISKQLISLLLAALLVLGLPITAMAAADAGSGEAAAQEETTSPTEPENTTDAADPTELTDPPAADGEETGLMITPDAIVAENPYDPDWPYPYGLPVDNNFPDDLLEADPYGISLMADMSLIPDAMYDNAILRALEYTGYDVQKMKDNGWLYVAQYTSANINSYAPEVLSGIGYDDSSPFLNGDETVADSGTVTGRAPNIAAFESNGLVCASFVTYYMCNYLPNIEGIDTTWIHDAVKATTMNNGSYSTASVWSWETGLTNLANKAGSGVTKYTDADTAYANLVPGDLIVFSNSSGSLTHIAVYAGTYTMYNASGTNRGPYHYIIHVGNSRGPEISAVEYMVSSGSKSSSPSAWYHIDLPEVQATGFIEVNKKDPSGKSLSGAYFTAVDQATGDKYVIGPTNASGYAKSGELPLGTYVVTETKFPAGYGPSGQTSWTVTLTEDTPNMTVTINAVNKLTTGSAKIVKATTNGGSKVGWHFEVKDSSGTVVGTYVTDASGVIVVDLTPGTYTVTETDGANKYWVNDPNPSRTVTVKADETATVTFTNQWRGQAQIIKIATNGGSVAGWHFTVKNSSGTVIGNYVTDATGIITLDLDPGTYTVTEKDGAKQYWENDPNSTRTVTVKAGETAKVTFKNQYKGAAQIIKTATNGGSVAGWHFEVKKSSGTVIGNYVTDSTGIIALALEPGTYTVTETDGEKEYWENDPNATKTVTVKAGQTAKVTFRNQWKGKAKIIKTATNDGKVNGWSFTIRNTNGTFVGKYTTDANGHIVADLEPGTYEIWETAVDDPYWLCDGTVRTVTIEAGETAEVSFRNQWTGKAKIIKKLGNPEAGTLEGWTFAISKVTQVNGQTDAAYLTTVTTGADGTILCDLEPGTYLVTEQLEEDSIWECVSGKSQTVTVAAGRTAEVTFTNVLRPAQITVYKVDPLGAPLAEAEFLLEWSEDGTNWEPVVYSDSVYVTKGGCSSDGLIEGKLVSGRDGMVTFTGLYPGLHYRLTETKAPDGYQLLSGYAFEGEITTEETPIVELTVVNAPVYELPMTGSHDGLLLKIAQITCAAFLLTLPGFQMVQAERKKHR